MSWRQACTLGLLMHWLCDMQLLGLKTLDGNAASFEASVAQLSLKPVLIIMMMG